MTDPVKGRRSIVDTFTGAVLKNPIPALITLWAVVYLPIAFGLSAAIREDTYELTLDGEDIVLRSDGVIIYYDRETRVRGTLLLGNDGGELSIEAEKGYIPMRLELEGYGKLYTADLYQWNRTWEIDDGIMGGDPGNSTWVVRIEEKVTDVPFYRDRGRTLLEGKLLYRDVATLNPPLINTFWLIPAALGGSFLVFRLYVSMFALLGGLITYGLGRRLYGKRVIWAAILLMLNPLTVYSSVGAVQDDVIVMVGFILVLMLLQMGWRRSSSAVLGLGMASKIFTILLLPGILMGEGKAIDKLKRISIALSIPVAVILPFLLLAPEGVMRFIGLYFTGDSGGVLHGVSLWRYLLDLGLLPSLVLSALPILLVLIGTSLFLRFRTRMAPIHAGWIFTILFLLFFPKVHSGYYLLLLPFAVQLFPEIDMGRMDRSLFILSLMVIGLDLANGFDWNEGPMIIVPIILSLSLMVLLIRVYGGVEFREALTR